MEIAQKSRVTPQNSAPSGKAGEKFPLGGKISTWGLFLVAQYFVNFPPFCSFFLWMGFPLFCFSH